MSFWQKVGFDPIQMHRIHLIMSPSHFFPFPKYKNQLQEICFNNSEGMSNALDDVIRSLTKEDFRNCFSDWFFQTHKCTDTKREYLEKIN